MSFVRGTRETFGILLLAIALLPGLAASGAAAATRGLPDFTVLVEENAPAVVNISATRRAEEPEQGDARDRLDEFFRQRDPRIPFPPRPRSGVAYGSGFVLGDGYILTNNHVVEEADEIVVRLIDRRELTAEVIGTDRLSDLALLKVEATDLPKVRLGNSERLKVGEWVLAIGSPFGFDYSVTAGIVSAKGRSLPTELNENYVPYLQTDVAINPGNSGGPLFNLAGEVVGINSQIFSQRGLLGEPSGYMGISFAIPINVAMDVVEQLRSTGRVSRGWLGVVIQNVDRDLAESFGLDRPHGALVSRVLPDSPAEHGGILEGDIITAINGRPIDLSSELPHHVGAIRAGTDAELEVIREGKSLKLTLQIGEAPDRDEAFAATRSIGAGGVSRLGLRVEALPEALREQHDIDGGVLVTEATGNAWESGLRPGDVITKLDNESVTDTDSFFAIAERLEPGRSVAVLVIRGQAPLFLALRVPDEDD